MFTGSVVPWDSKNQFYAFFRFLADALHSGASPFWNPYHYGGHPSIADPQSLIFAPLFFLWALIDPTPSIRAFDLLVYAHLLIGGIAMAAIGWRARWPLPANILAALPRLPDDIQYRFLGPHLVLHDIRANIILDRLPCAIRCD